MIKVTESNNEAGKNIFMRDDMFDNGRLLK